MVRDASLAGPFVLLNVQWQNGSESLDTSSHLPLAPPPPPPPAGLLSSVSVQEPHQVDEVELTNRNSPTVCLP